MKTSLLIATPAFLPRIGGIENIALSLANAASNRGLAVSVATSTSAPAHFDEQFSFPVFRSPSSAQLFALYRDHATVLLLQGPSSLGWPTFFYGSKTIVIYQIWVRWANRPSVFGYIVGWLIRRISTVTACSPTVAATLGVPSKIVPNPYNDLVFRVLNFGPRRFDIAFTGRMITWKGLDVLFQALKILKNRGVPCKTVCVGEGPDFGQFRKLAEDLAISETITWTGALKPCDVATVLNDSKVLCVPSTWEEPFGIVALEGLACGCEVIVSSSGGLPSAVGKAGLVFQNGQPEELAEKIEKVLLNWSIERICNTIALDHLQKHTGEAILNEYLSLRKDRS